MNIIKKSELLPSYYTEVSEPSFTGKGNHSVMQLENICEQYKELVHQLRVREQMLLAKFNILIVSDNSTDDTNEKSENTCSSPLELRWDTLTSQYKVNKPNIKSGVYVDKKIADEMIETLKGAKHTLDKINSVIEEDGACTITVKQETITDEINELLEKNK